MDILKLDEKNMNSEYSIFISYKRKDKEKVFVIKDYIERHTGKKCWIDLLGIESDELYTNVIIKAINKTKIFLFMYSSSHTEIDDLTDDWTMREISFARKKGKKIIFINIDKSPLTDWFELNFGLKQQIDASSEIEMEKLCQDLSKCFHSNNNVIMNSNYIKIKGNVFSVEKEQIKFDMIRVEGGQLEIGATKKQITYADKNEFPAHIVTLPTFYIGKFPVTQNIWEHVMGYNKSCFKYNEGDYPVENLSHDDALIFVNRLSKLTNIYFDLPTEEEWEYAARGGQRSKHFRFAGSDDIDKVAWYNENSGGRTHPVGEKEPNELGIYDMCGNVWEWTKTPAHSYTMNINPGGNYFIRRGGSWWQKSEDCRISRRYPSDHIKKTSGLGLRVVIRENIE